MASPAPLPDGGPALVPSSAAAAPALAPPSPPLTPESPDARPEGREWTLPALSGRLVELTGAHTPRLSLATRLVVQAQQDAQPAAWIAVGGSCFHPPDAAAAGIDLAALPVVDAPDRRAAARAADHLLRSGAFGLVVIDLPAGADLPLPVQSRLAGLARHHHAALLCLTRGPRPRERRAPAVDGALGSLVSLRAEGETIRLGEGRFRCRLRATKDKRRGPGWTHEEIRRGPDGLC